MSDVVTTRVVIPTLGGQDAKETIEAVTTAINHSIELGFHVSFQWYDVSSSDQDYYYLLESLWSQQKPFVVIERDIIVNEDTLTSFLTCENNWCAAPYPYIKMDAYLGMGAMRFSKELMENHPRIWEEVAKIDSTIHPSRHWCTLDAYLQTNLMSRGEQICGRHGKVGHLDLVPSHGCVVMT